MNNQRKKNLLVITLSPPLPASSGAPIYITNTLLPLAEKYNLHLFTIGGEAEVRHIEKHKTEYNRYFKSVHIEPRATMPSQKGTAGRIIHVLEHCYHGLPFMDASYYSKAAVKNASRIIREQKIDAMEIHSAHLAFFKKFFPNIPALLVGHNIESDIFPFWIPQNLQGWKKSAVEFAAEKSRKNAHGVEFENKWKFEAMTFISQNDMDRVHADVQKSYIPLCLPVQDIDYLQKPSAPINLLWMGGFWWYPNAEGALWFARDILPLIREKLDELNINIHFLGAAPPDDLKAVDDGKRVFVHGFVDSLKEVLDKTHLLFVPLLSGGGVRVKILEAMSNGIPVISTTKGCEGLGATDGVNIMIRNTPAEFASGLVEMVKDGELRARLSSAGRALLNEKYNLAKCIAEKDRIYQKILASR
ncbi:glycosyltransferase [Pseudomonas nitroreducens]|uniref:glycosyltransferase n=1 Tax=Pseudomonas nitroreducens TaxID=46680 RepID=UPI002D809267|nr:glycosyltransferase [Pseudomonas nitroreducens]